jgi:methionyl-tRNA formyltransferase
MPEPETGDEAISTLFLGTPSFAVPSLKVLHTNPRIKIHAVVTQPDRRQGRGMKSAPPEIRKVAQTLGLEVLQPTSLKEEEFRPILEKFPALDMIFVVAYGRKIPAWLLNYPKFGCLNLHPSLLPKYRGGAPMRRALFNGDTVTGVTTMYLDEGWDTGDVIYQEEVPIPENSNYGQLSDILSQKGAQLLLKTALSVSEAAAPRQKQDESRATHEPLLKKEDEWIDWSRPAVEIHHLVRGLSPAPGAHTRLRDKSFRILQTLPDESASPDRVPGEVIAARKKEGLWVATGQGALQIKQIQPAGKKPMAVTDFLNGYQIKEGEKFTGID